MHLREMTVFYGAVIMTIQKFFFALNIHKYFTPHLPFADYFLYFALLLFFFVGQETVWQLPLMFPNHHRSSEEKMHLRVVYM